MNMPFSSPTHAAPRLAGIVLLGLPLLAGSPLLAGCGARVPRGAARAGGADAGSVGATDAGTDAAAAACVPVDPQCQDPSISMLDLFDTVSPASITEEGTTEGEFLSRVDATGGGTMPSQSYVYARFTEAGLEKVAISDEDALSSTDWDIAFRRFIIRLNSGVSGPSCVEAARTAPATTFDGLASVPEGLSYRTEGYFTEGSCDLVPDGSGLGSPATALSSYWTYPGCVSMTRNVYVVRPASGRHVKLQVVGYYPLENQEMCDTMSRVPMPSGGGQIRVRWAFLD
ncbi:MAG: HmuY family protein [Deltaproteobacteria bacterium]